MKNINELKENDFLPDINCRRSFFIIGGKIECLPINTSLIFIADLLFFPFSVIINKITLREDTIYDLSFSGTYKECKPY